MTNSVALRKAVVFTLIAALCAWTVAAYGFSLTQTAQAASAGDLIKMDGNPAVYYLGSDLKRYVFPNEKTYMTWYDGFSGVVTVSQSELESYAIGGNVTYRAGTRLGKITTDPKVYSIEPGGVLRWITSETIASDLYGSNWNQRIDDIPDPFFVNYTVGTDLTSSNYPSGQLVKMSGSADVYYIDGTSKRMVQDASAMGANGFMDKWVIETSLDLSGLTAGSPITGSETELMTTAGPEVGTPPVSSTGSLAISLASDTPASGTAVNNAARVGFTKVNMTATGGDVTVDSVIVERMGLSLNSNFSDIILLDVSNATPVQFAEQIDNEKNLSSDNLATFNQDIVVPNGATKSILIAGNMSSSLSAGENAMLGLKEVKLSGSATMTGSLPVVGNAMTMNGSVTIASVTVAAGGQNPGASTQNVGTNDYIFRSLRLTNNSSVEDVEVHRLLFTQKGTADDDDVQNFDLVVDGSVVKSVKMADNKKVDFKLDTPITIGEGNNKEFSLRGDIMDGSGRTISLDVENKIDVVVKGKTYGYFRIPTYPNTSRPYFGTTGDDTSISRGSITFSKGVISSLNVAEGGDQQPLGAFKATVQGESVDVTQFAVNVGVTGTGNAQDVSNIRIKDASGKVIGGPVDPSTTGQRATSTDTITFPVGTNTYTVEGDLNNDFGANDTIVLTVSDPSTYVIAEGNVTNESITPGPTSDLALDTVTVKVGAMDASVSATPAGQSVIVGQSGFTFANFILDASASGEAIRVTQIAVKHTTSANSIQSNIANLQLFDGATALFPIQQPTSQVATVATSTFSLTNPIVVPKGGNKTLTIKGDIVGGTSGQTHSFGLNGSSLTGVGVDTANTITANVTASDGQTMEIASTGSLTMAGDSSSPTSDGLFVGGASKVTVGVLNMTAENEDLDLTSIHLDAAAVNGGALNDEFSRVYLYDGSTEIASAVPTTTDTITFGNMAGKFMIPKGSSGKKLTVKVDTSEVTNTKGDGYPGDSGDGITFSIAEDAYSAKGQYSGSDVTAANKTGTFSGKSFTIHKSVPTFEKLALASNTLFDSSGVPMFKFKLTADPKGDIGFYKASFLVATSGVSASSFELIESPGTGSEVNLTTDAARSVSAYNNDTQWMLDILFDISTDGQGDIRTVSAGSSKTFELRGSVTGSSSGDTVSVSMLGDLLRNSAYPDEATNIDSEEQNDFIWSDLFWGSATDTSSGIPEWFNGYKVPGLSSTTTAETLTK